MELLERARVFCCGESIKQHSLLQVAAYESYVLKPMCILFSTCVMKTGTDVKDHLLLDVKLQETKEQKQPDL